jgi:Tfp pilus assembly protein PilV
LVTPPHSRRRAPTPAGFTIVEVMMASVILVVGFMGMISAVTVCAEMLATAQRQTIAAQIIDNEIEQLRIQSWSTVNALSVSTTWASGAAYGVGDIIRYNGGWYSCLRAHTASVLITPMESVYWSAYMTYAATTTYTKGDIVYYVSAGVGSWYRYINSTAAAGTLPTNTTYWSTYSGAVSSDGVSAGVSFTITREVVNLAYDTDGTTPVLRQVSYVVSWTKGGTTDAASTTTGSWLQQIAFRRDSPISRTYMRRSTTWVAKYGLNAAASRS